MLADADAVKIEVAFLLGDRNQAEVRSPATDVADKDDVPGANLRAPVLSGLRSPGVERRQRLLQQNDLAETGGFRSFRGQVSRNVVEGGRDGQHDLRIRQSQILAPSLYRVAETFPDVLKIAARAVERGQFFFPDLRLPRKGSLPRIDMGI